MLDSIKHFGLIDRQIWESWIVDIVEDAIRYNKNGAYIVHWIDEYSCPGNFYKFLKAADELIGKKGCHALLIDFRHKLEQYHIDLERGI